jgi:hypothetical protein
LVRGFHKHTANEHASAVTAEAIEVLRLHGSTPSGALAVLAATAASGDPTIAPSFAALTNRLLAAL